MPNAYQDRQHRAAADPVAEMISDLMRHGFTPSAIGNRCDTSRSTISRVLAGTAILSPDIVTKLATMHRKYGAPKNTVAGLPLDGKL